MADERVLTHHTNIRNPRTGKVTTFEPGADLPQWAKDILLAEDHVAYVEKTPEAERTVRGWQISKAAAELANEG